MLTSDLRNMEQSVNTGIELNESTEIGHACNLTGNNIANGKFRLCVNPRVLVGELHRESYLLALDLLNICLNGLANREYLLGILDAAP